MTRHVYLVVAKGNVAHLSHTPLHVGADVELAFHYTFKSDDVGERVLLEARNERGGGGAMHLLHGYVEYEYATVERIK
jgi:hypothetical protein